MDPDKTLDDLQSVMHAGAVLDPGVLSSVTTSALRTEYGGKVCKFMDLLDSAI